MERSSHPDRAATQPSALPFPNLMALLIPEEELVVSAPEARVVEGDGGESPRLEFEFKIRQADRELAIGFSF